MGRKSFDDYGGKSFTHYSTLDACPDCGDRIINAGAHAEACYGRPVMEGFTGWYSCGCPQHGWTRDGGRCESMRPRRPVFRPRVHEGEKS